jgi:hypothetical protein
VPREPFVLSPAPDEPEQQAGGPRREDRGAAEVERGSRRAARFGIASRTTISASPPTGRLIVKIQRQLELSTMKPPIAGPAMDDAANVAPIRPW